MDFEDLEREIDEPPPKVTGDPLFNFDDDWYEIEQYIWSCGQERHMSLVDNMYELEDEITAEELQRRNAIIESYREKAGFPKNILNFRRHDILYQSWELGLSLSNILTGYLIGHKVKSRKVDHKVCTPTGIFGFDFKKITGDDEDVIQNKIKKHATSFEATIMDWLDQSDLWKYLKYTSVRQIARNTGREHMYIVRRSFILDFQHYMYENNEDQTTMLDEFGNKISKDAAHTVLLFWQAVRNYKDDRIEYGIADNLCEERNEIYGFDDGLNVNFYVLFDLVFKKYCRKYIGRQQASELSMICLQNNIPAAYTVNKKYGKFDLNCYTQNRRMLIYFSLLYDINNVNKLMESTDMESKYFRLFEAHTRLFVHHMNRMMHWLMTTKLIWPAKRQQTPNRHRPCCIVRPCHPFDKVTMTEYYEKSLEDTMRHKLCVELNENTACLDFYNPVKGRKVKYWFKWDGDSAFSAKEEYDQHCVVQAVVELLEERVRLLV